MSHRPTTEPQPQTRRGFLHGGSIAALGVGLMAHAGAQATEATPTGTAARIDARDLGATGDGVTDDTEAIQAALAKAEADALAAVYLPAGTFRLSDTLRLPSSVCLVGTGAGLTTLQAIPGTLFPLFRPDPRTQEIRQRRAMVTTHSVGTVRGTVARDTGLAHLTVDWNHCPTDGYGSSCVLIDSADHCRLQNVRFTRCMPSDHPRSIDQMRGSGFRSECIMFSNSQHALMDGCELVDSGYRPLSVAYGSQDIAFQNGRIVASNPVWRHAFAEVHGDGIARDEHYVRSQLKLLHSTFILEGGTAQDGVCSHTGTMVIENCDFHIQSGTEHLGYVVKPFDGSRRCQCLNNRFHCEGDYEQRFSIIGSIGERTNEEMLFVGNIINVAFTADAGDRIADRGLVDFSRSEVRCRVQDNQFLIHLEQPGAMPAIRLKNSRGFTVAGNLIEFRGATDDQGPTGIEVSDCTAGTVSGNVITGDCDRGVRLEGQLDGVLVSGNVLPAAGLSDDSQGNRLLDGNAEARG